MRKQTKQLDTDIIFILDRSGSMQGTEEDTIGGYNSFIKEHQDKNTKITTILFDDKYEVLYQREDIDKVKELTKNEYYVRGCTALMDAIGKTINSLTKEVKDNKVLFVITTDGLENASTEYNKEKVRKLISSHPNWEFIYIGANIDSYSEASSLGISASHTANYRKDKKGIGMLFESVSKAARNVSMGCSLDTSWKEELDNYIEKSQK